MKVIWTQKATQDRHEIIDYIAADNINAALKLDQLFENAADKLTEQPRMGKKGQIKDTRELIPHKSYRMVYQIEAETVSILTLIRTAKPWPPKKPWTMYDDEGMNTLNAAAQSLPSNSNSRPRPTTPTF
jgi:addiction module RelE/StbE family toxin